MKIITKLGNIIHQKGIRGVASGLLHYVANKIEPKQINKSVTGQTREFLAWVQFSVPGMLGQGNVEAMDYAISSMPTGKPVLEIGSFCGLSTIVLTYLLEQHSRNVSLFTCDKWEFEGQQPGTSLGDSRSVTHDTYRTYVKDSFLRNMKTFSASKLPYTIECLSDEFFSRWFANENILDVFERPVTLGGEISFCYIDGNHTYEFVKRDFDNTDQFLVPGGFILFDDSADGRKHQEVNKLTREIICEGKYELISRNPNYLFRKK